MTAPLLKWTGHPLADVGVATLCAMARKNEPEALTAEDLDKAGRELSEAYTDPIFMSYLSCVFTMNAPYTNPTTGAESRKASLKRLLSPHRSQPDEAARGLRCVFSGDPATHMMERSQMPMLTGAGVMNFYPAGRSELPVAAPYLLALQAIAMGCRRSEGKLLLVHCDDPQFTLQFASRYLDRNRKLIDLARSKKLPDRDGPSDILDRECAGWDSGKKRPKYPDAKAPQSLVMDDLVEVVLERGRGRMANASTSITVYLISNSGQGPSLSIEHIPGEFVLFLAELCGSKVGALWTRLVGRSWRAGKGEEQPDGTGQLKRSKKKEKSESRPVRRGAGISRNDLYNDLFAIFAHGFVDSQAASRFIRRHLLSDPSRIYFVDYKSANQSPRFGKEQLELMDWELTSLFLERVLGMNKERLEAIRRFADHLADMIDEHNDKRLFRDLVFTTGEWQYRLVLTKVQRQYAHERNQLLFGFDDYLNIFLADDAGDRVIWSMVRDLISIRLVEQLFRKKFFDRADNSDVLDQPQGAETVDSS